MPGVSSAGGRVSIVLRRAGEIIKLRTFEFPRPDVSEHFHADGLYDRSGFEAFLGAYTIPAGTYDLGVMVENGGQTALHWEPVPITVSSLPLALP